MRTVTSATTNSFFIILLSVFKGSVLGALSTDQESLNIFYFYFIEGDFQSKENGRHLVALLGMDFPMEVEINQAIIECEWHHKNATYFIAEGGSYGGTINGHFCLKYFHHVSQAETAEWK